MNPESIQYYNENLQILWMGMFMIVPINVLACGVTLALWDEMESRIIQPLYV